LSAALATPSPSRSLSQDVTATVAVGVELVVVLRRLAVVDLVGDVVAVGVALHRDPARRGGSRGRRGVRGGLGRPGPRERDEDGQQREQEGSHRRAR
jgi:hypothetical protein